MSLRHSPRITGLAIACLVGVGCTHPGEAVVDPKADAGHSDPDAGNAGGPQPEADAATHAAPDEDDAGSPPAPAQPSASDARPCDFDTGPAADLTTDNPRCPKGIYVGDLTLTDLNFGDLLGCVRMRGNLFIHTDQRRDLRGLEALHVIEGSLRVMEECDAEGCRDQPALASVQGLNHLRCVTEDVTIGRVMGSQLATLDSLSELIEVGGALTLNVLGVAAADQLKSLRRVWGSLSCQAIVPLPALTTIYGHLLPQPFSSRDWPDPTPVLDYIGCDPRYVPCRDGYLGCDFLVESQTDLARLTRCERTGNVTLQLQGSTLVDLTPLKRMREIGGSLTIGNAPAPNAPALESLAGLEALERSGEVHLADLPKLRTLSGLTRLRHVAQLRIAACPELQDLTGLGPVAPPTALVLSGNTGLLSTAGWNATSDARINVDDCPLLSHLSGLVDSRASRLTELRLRALPALLDLNDLTALTRIDTLSIDHCDKLVDLGGLHELTQVRLVELLNNAALMDLRGLSQLESLANLISAGNPQVVSLPSLPPIGAVGLVISDTLHMQDLTGLEKLSGLSYIYLSNNTALTSLRGLSPQQTAATDISISENPALMSLQGWSFERADLVYIAKNAQLTSLEGMAGLRRVGTLGIWHNPKLENLDALSGLQSIDSSFDLQDNPALTSVQGLANVMPAANGLDVVDNSQLPQCEIEQLLQRFPNVASPVVSDNGPPGACTPW